MNLTNLECIFLKYGCAIVTIQFENIYIFGTMIILNSWQDESSPTFLILHSFESASGQVHNEYSHADLKFQWYFVSHAYIIVKVSLV